MLVLSIQNKTLDVSKLIYPTKPCRYNELQNVYNKMYRDYNERKKTNYDNFFWGFTKLICKKCNEEWAMYREDCTLFKKCVMIGCDMLGIWGEALNNFQGLLLNIPEELCLASSYYTYADVAYTHLENDDECWNEIYGNIEDETQVIFPYISPEMILHKFSPNEVLNSKNWSDDFEDKIRESLSSLIF